MLLWVQFISPSLLARCSHRLSCTYKGQLHSSKVPWHGGLLNVRCREGGLIISHYRQNSDMRDPGLSSSILSLVTLLLNVPTTEPSSLQGASARGAPWKLNPPPCHFYFQVKCGYRSYLNPASMGLRVCMCLIADGPKPRPCLCACL